MISLDTDKEHRQTQTQIKSKCDLKEVMNAELSFSLHTSSVVLLLIYPV